MFRLIRDARVFRDPERRYFPRRIGWLYPVDGCYLRAASGVEVLRTLGPRARSAAKVFLFGDLRFKTDYAPRGTAFWSYHVALIVRVGEDAYVLDPAIDWSGPLTLAEWIAKQSERPAATRIALCGGATYKPSDRCETQRARRADPRLEADELRYLTLEWQNLADLGGTPAIELGLAPPWAPAH